MTTLSLTSGFEAHATSWPTCEGGHEHRARSNTAGLMKVVQAYAPLAASSRLNSQGGARCHLKTLSSKQSCPMLCFIKTNMAKGMPSRRLLCYAGTGLPAESGLWSQGSTLTSVAPCPWGMSPSRGVSYQLISLLASCGCSVCCGWLASISWTAAACWVRREGLGGLCIYICFRRPSVGLRGLKRTVSKLARRSSVHVCQLAIRSASAMGATSKLKSLPRCGGTTVTSPACWVVHRGLQPHCTAACHLQPTASVAPGWVCCSD